MRYTLPKRWWRAGDGFLQSPKQAYIYQQSAARFERKHGAGSAAPMRGELGVIHGIRIIQTAGY